MRSHICMPPPSPAAHSPVRLPASLQARSSHVPNPVICPALRPHPGCPLSYLLPGRAGCSLGFRSQPLPHPLTPPLLCPLPRAAVCTPLLRRPLPPRALPAQPLSAAGGAAVLLRPSQAARPTPRNRSRRLELAGPRSLHALLFLFAQVRLSTTYPRRRCFPPVAICHSHPGAAVSAATPFSAIASLSRAFMGFRYSFRMRT